MLFSSQLLVQWLQVGSLKSATGHGGSMYTMEIGKCYNQDFLFSDRQLLNIYKRFTAQIYLLQRIIY